MLESDKFEYLEATEVTEVNSMVVYGALKSGEIGHRIVKDLLAERPIPVSVLDFELMVVDGVATAIERPDCVLQGELLRFIDGVAAYKKISLFEGVPDFYRWGTVSTSLGQANMLMSPSPIRTRHDKITSWSSAEDGLLAYGIPWSHSRLQGIKVRLVGNMRDLEFWTAYHDLQSTFQLLWSITERILLFHDGPTESKSKLGDKISWLRDMTKHPGLRDAVNAVQIDRHVGIRSNRAPSAAEPSRAGNSGFQAWYAMRNNVVHRGKSTRAERGPLWVATVDLHNTLAHFLQHNSTPIKDLWLNLTKLEDIPYPNWLYKIQR